MANELINEDNVRKHKTVKISKDEVCNVCGRGRTIQSFLLACMIRLEYGDEVDITASQNNMATAERLVRLLKCVGVLEDKNRTLETIELTSKKTGKTTMLELTRIYLKKVGAIRDYRTMR